MPIYTTDDLPENFSKEFIAFTAEDDMLKFTKPLREKFGIHYFVHIIYLYDGRSTFLITHGQVAMHWVIQQYVMPANDHKGGHLPSGNYLVSHMGGIFPEAYRKSLLELFDIDHMLAIIDSNHLSSEIFVFGSESNNFQIVNFYLNNINVLKNFILYYKEQAKNLIQKTMNEWLLLPPAIEVIQNTTDLNISNTKKRIRIKDNIWLSERETECLILTTKGKTAKQIAKALDISSRTVEYHLDASKQKLDCHFKSELIEKFTKIFDCDFS